MKKNLPLLLICLLSILLFSTCKKSTPTPATAVTGMSFKVDGVATKMDFAGATMLNLSVAQISITGSTANSVYPGIVMVIRSPIIGVNPVVSFSYMTSADNQGFFTPSSSGQMTITSLTSTNVTGTFQFTCTNTLGNPVVTKVITEGVFNCPVTQQ